MTQFVSSLHVPMPFSMNKKMKTFLYKKFVLNENEFHISVYKKYEMIDFHISIQTMYSEQFMFILGIGIFGYSFYTGLFKRAKQ